MKRILFMYLLILYSIVCTIMVGLLFWLIFNL